MYFHHALQLRTVFEASIEYTTLRYTEGSTSTQIVFSHEAKGFLAIPNRACSSLTSFSS